VLCGGGYFLKIFLNLKYIKIFFYFNINTLKNHLQILKNILNIFLNKKYL